MSSGSKEESERKSEFDKGKGGPKYRWRAGS